jgi:hypothetical protein
MSAVRPQGFRLLTRAAAAPLACLFLTLTGSPAFAQQPHPPLMDAPDRVEFLSRYDFHLAAAVLADNSDDHRFSWDTHWGGGIDLVDYVAGRLSMYADYQAVLGNEYRPFDPNQGNYTLAVAGSARAGRTEIAGVFHHVSRHLSDRPKRQSIAMNALLVRVLRAYSAGETTFTVRAETGPVIAHAYVDYTWMTAADLQVRRPLTDQVALFGRAVGEMYQVDEEIAQRKGQQGGRLEGGVRWSGTGGAIELFGGFEQMIDADPLDRQPRQWGFFGFRVINN